MNVKYHQNITIGGVDQPAEYNNRKNSQFFNEGKWRNFIKPLLPPDPQDRVFVEIGCNVGLYLRLAQEYGFDRVVGVEANADNCEMAERYRAAHELDYKILHRTVGLDFDWDELPAADVVLLSNVHYYIPMSVFLPFLDRMRFKAIYCIVVSRQMRDKKHGHPLPEEGPIRLMFRDWHMLRVLQTSMNMLKDDPHPRRVHSLLFQSNLQRQPISDYARRWSAYKKQQELIDIVHGGQEVNLQETDNWRYWKRRKQEDKEKPEDKWSNEQITAHVQYRLDVVRDIMAYGMKEPILVYPDRTGIDGGNRAAILKLLGHESIIVRIV